MKTQNSFWDEQLGKATQTSGYSIMNVESDLLQASEMSCDRKSSLPYCLLITEARIALVTASLSVRSFSSPLTKSAIQNMIIKQCHCVQVSELTCHITYKQKLPVFKKYTTSKVLNG